MYVLFVIKLLQLFGDGMAGCRKQNASNENMHIVVFMYFNVLEFFLQNGLSNTLMNPHIP